MEHDCNISYARAIALEIRRCLSEKRFWIALGAVLCYLLLECVIDCLFPFTLFYNGDEETMYLFGHNTPSRGNLFQSELSGTLFVSFFPFFAVLAYGHSKIDDRKHRFDMQLIQRMGFLKYFVSKAVSTSLLGALFCGMIPLMFAVMLELFFEKNIFLKDAVAFYAQLAAETEYNPFIYFYSRELGEIKGYWPFVFYVTVMCFFAGIVFAFLGYVVSLFIENKVLFYSFPVLFLQFWDRMVATVSAAYRALHDGAYSLLIGSLFLKSKMPSGENLSYICTLGIILTFSVFLAVWSYPKIEETYREGAGI